MNNNKVEELAQEIIDYFGDKLVNHQQYPKQFNAQLRLFKHIKSLEDAKETKETT